MLSNCWLIIAKRALTPALKTKGLLMYCKMVNTQANLKFRLDFEYFKDIKLAISFQKEEKNGKIIKKL